MSHAGTFEAVRIIQDLVNAMEAVEAVRDASTRAYVRASEHRNRCARSKIDDSTLTLSEGETEAWKALTIEIGAWRDRLFDETDNADLRRLIRRVSEQVES